MSIKAKTPASADRSTDIAVTHGPAVGVVIRTRDRPLFVSRALRAVFAQTHQNWKIALVNDGGARAPLEAAIETLKREGTAPGPDRLEVIHRAKSQGRSAAFNLGLTTLDTAFVTCLDDDDTWTPDFMESLLAFHARLAPDVPDLGGVLAMVTALREEIDGADGTQTLVPLGEDWLPHSFRRREAFIDPVAYAAYRQDLYPVQWMLKRQAVVETGGFPESFTVMEDRAFMLQFLQHWRLALLDRPLAFHHRRVRRKEDTLQTVEMNTLDNPSYDWRLFAELAKLPLHGPATDAADAPVPAALGKLIRATATTVLKELNDETSALWHKIDGEARNLAKRLTEVEALVARGEQASPLERDIETECFALAAHLGPKDLGFALSPGIPFAGRFEMSMATEGRGLLMHWSGDAQRFAIQVPQTGDWAALELDLEGYLGSSAGLACTLVTESGTGFLFETALSLQTTQNGRIAHRLAHHHVHHCPGNQCVTIRHDFPRHHLLEGTRPRLSIILPRQAANFRLVLRDLMVNRL